MASSISGAADALSGSSGLLSAFKGQFHGSSKAMAQALGVTPRTVQRWFTKGAEQRKPSKAARAKMAQHVPVQAHVSGQFAWDTPGGSGDTRHRNITFDVSAADMAAIRGASSPEQAREAFFEAYGMAAPDQVIGADYSFSLGG